jgi:hypothetical protein
VCEKRSHLVARQEKPPEGFAIAQLPDGRYYPLIVEHFYSADHPDGMLALYPHIGHKGDDSASFPLRAEALAFCKELAEINASLERGRFEHLAVESDCYPERCAWYCDLIEEVTGRLPQIMCCYRYLQVTALSYICPVCRVYHESVWTVALTIEEALAQAAETIYARYARCRAYAAATQGIGQEGERHAS